MRYKVWNPDCEGEDDALLIRETSPALAGENYVSQIADGYSDSYELMVVDEDGNLFEVEVDVDYTPTIMSYAKKVQK